MKRFFLMTIGFVALSVPVAVMAGSGESEFDGVVRSIESRYHVHANRIPFLGLISFVSKRATHGGVGALHVAEIDSFTEQVDGNELDRIVEEKLGEGWERTVRETSKKGSEQTLVFTRPEGNRMAMLVVDPRHLDDDIGHYSHHHEREDSDSETNGSSN